MKVVRRRKVDGKDEVHEFDTADRGLECPKCNCRHFRTVKTVPVADHVRRVRVCRNCGWSGKSLERLIT